MIAAHRYPYSYRGCWGTCGYIMSIILEGLSWVQGPLYAIVCAGNIFFAARMV
jgi:hypothetical protein